MGASHLVKTKRTLTDELPTGCTMPFVDVKTKVPSHHILLILNTALNLVSKNVVYNLMDHPVDLM